MAHYDVAIIGAGVSGAACATALSKRGRSVRLFDKGRGPGGRLSTRRNDSGTWDHGAEFFTAHGSDFRALVASAHEAGAAQIWSPRLAHLNARGLHTVEETKERWVGTPGMSSFVRFLLDGHQVSWSTRILSLGGEPGRWHLGVEDLDGAETSDTFSAVVFAIPAPQAVELLPGASLLRATAQTAVMEPCVAVMMGFEAALESLHDRLEVGLADHAIAVATRDSSKPLRAEGERWVIHATPQYSRDHFREPDENHANTLFDALASTLGVSVPAPKTLMVHRWLYARVATTGQGRQVDQAQLLAMTGDHCEGPRVEAAFDNGRRVGHEVDQIL